MPDNHERFKIDPASHFAFRSRKAIPALDGFSFIPPDRPERKGVFTNWFWEKEERLGLCPERREIPFVQTSSFPLFRQKNAEECGTSTSGGSKGGAAAYGELSEKSVMGGHRNCTGSLCMSRKPRDMGHPLF
jgi:hypothetical protein